MDLDRGRGIVVPRGVRAARRAPDKRGGPRHVLAHASLRRRRREFREFFAPRATEPILPVPVSARKRKKKQTKRDQPRRLFFGSALVARGRHDCPQLHLYVARRVRPGSRRGVRRGRDFPKADAFGRRRRGAERLGGRVRREKAAFAIGGGDVPRPIRGQDLRRERFFGVSGEGRHTALARGLDGRARRCIDRGRVVTTFLQKFFERYVDYDFTANMEEELDAIASGHVEWKEALRQFWIDFSKAVENTKPLTITEVLDYLDAELGPHFFPRGDDDRGGIDGNTARRRGAVEWWTDGWDSDRKLCAGEWMDIQNKRLRFLSRWPTTTAMPCGLRSRWSLVRG